MIPIDIHFEWFFPGSILFLIFNIFVESIFE